MPQTTRTGCDKQDLRGICLTGLDRLGNYPRCTMRCSFVVFVIHLTRLRHRRARTTDERSTAVAAEQVKNIVLGRGKTGR